MRILVYGINYAPELTGIGKYTTELCEWLCDHSHTVEAITALPYYPEWRIHDSHRAKYWHRETIRGVAVYRCPLYVPAQVSGLKRMLHDFSFFLSSAVQWSKALFRRYDLVFCIYPPLPIGLFPLLYRLLHRKNIWLHIQDLQVDAAREFGIIRNKPLLRALEAYERLMLRRMQVVSTISEGMRDRIARKGLDPAAIVLFPNWTDPGKFYPMQRQRPALKQQFGFLPDDKVVLYAGNIGEKQGLEMVLDVAERYKTAHPEVKFMIVGDGAARERLVQSAWAKKLENVRFGAFVPDEQLPELLNMADVHLVLQKKGASSLVMPSKLGNILACGGTVVMSLDPETGLYQELEREKIAAVCPPEDLEAFAGQMHRVLFDESPVIAESIRKFVASRIEKEQILHKFLEKITQLTNT